MNKPYLRIIGDAHGKYDKYVKIAKQARYSLQIGDMGFDYRFLDRVLEADDHKIIGGNHDNYTRKICEACPGKECIHCKGKGFVYLHQTKHFLGDFGVHQIPDFPSIFYIRGAWSIDKQWRRPGIDWWENEELTFQECEEAIKLYEQVKPDFMVTHTAPDGIIPEIPFDRIFGDKLHHPRTEVMLQRLWEIHQPKIWIFGHFHIDWDEVINTTRFICLDELSYKDFDANYNGLG